MIHNKIIVWDLETTSSRPSDTEIAQIAAVVLDPLSLSIIPNVQFNSLMMPLRPDLIEEGALAVNHLTREQLAAAPHPSEVWANFASWVRQWSYKGKGDAYSSPIPAGHNIVGFDYPIYERYCHRYKTTRVKRNGEVVPSIFNTIWKYDTLLMMAAWTENLTEPSKLSLDFLRKYFAMPTPEGGRHTHDALRDVQDTAAILIRLLRLHRRHADKTIWKDSFDETKVAKEVKVRRDNKEKRDTNEEEKRSRKQRQNS